MLAPETKVSFYQYSEKNFTVFFFLNGKKLLFCDSIKRLITAMGTSWTLSVWKLFIDSSKRSLKCVLFHIGNKLAFLSTVHSI